ncbi:hypothetical protein G6F59_016837 [Rhizopus arrhizus]|nr:hypothetical protein G6F59_016837 [Rhizopus arrhizus]
MHIAVAVVERDAEHLALALAAHIGHDVAHRQATVAKAAHPAHLAGEAVGMYGQPAKRRALGVGLADLVVHENRDRHRPDYRARRPSSVRW